MKKPYSAKESSSSAPKFIGLFLLLTFVFMLGWNAGVNHNQIQQGLAPKTTVTSPLGQTETINMQLFWDAWNILSSNFVDPHALVTENMIFGAIKGMVASVNDPYTNFMTPKENREFQESMQGHLEGIGAELTLRNGMLTVISPLKNSPAQKAGLQPEDIIYEVDGNSTEDMTLEQAVMKIRGEKGSVVTLTVLRKNYSEPIKLRIVRDTININSIDWKMKGDIAIIEINQFGDNTKQEFSKAISEILLKRPKGVVLDLRYNGGGYLDGAIDITSEFLEKEKVVTIKKRNPAEDEVIYVNGQARMANIPLAILINKGSASASEIVAGAIQDNNRGIIIGENSFGKGTVQSVENLIGGSSLRVTIAKWFTPNDQNINENGITPDIVVERTIEDIEADRDPQLEKAIEYLESLDS
ncbi:S41 family peptidase [Patescibacteria group bacterium]|nr:S41 family peptidase [Patescibacteria group bacterium]MBU1016468.1 S41 family peptidase [Patescibacteria group bacterium]MBU1684966.1 S41 family peptidase [Patescibacteria group bacterium]MBU1939006.1 S41 family peptidase [Patescibacteria group bacterium]